MKLGIIKIFLFTVLLSACKDDNKNKPLNNNILKENNEYIKTDASILDISWWPNDYPTKKMQGDTLQKLMARIIYSRPLKKGRSIFGPTNNNLCEYGKKWRLGANEATEITFFDDVNINNDMLKKGTYIMYCIPQESNWTIFFNTDLNTWGLNIDSKKDVFKTTVPISMQEPSIEKFTMLFEPTKLGSNLVMAWDNVKAILPISFIK